MKKLFSLAMMAVAALVAATFVSCGSDEKDDSSSVPFNFTCEITTSSTSEQVLDVVTNYFKNIVGGDATVTRSGKSINISGTGDKKSAVWEKIANSKLTPLNESFNSMKCVKDLYFLLQGVENLDYAYTINPNLLIPGTYTAKIGSTDCRIVIKESTDGVNFATTATYGSETYAGNVKYEGQLQIWHFLSDDETDEKPTFNFSSKVGCYDSFSSDCKTFTVDTQYKGVDTDNIVFTRQ